MKLVRSNDIKKVVVHKEEINEGYAFCEGLKYKMEQTTKFPWWKFKKEIKQILELDVPDGFYTDNFKTKRMTNHIDSTPDTKEENERFIKEQCLLTITDKNLKIVDKKVYYKACVYILFFDNVQEYIYFDTNEQAVEYAMSFKGINGLDIVLDN